jgi:GNAT superfamily N-acetyltransferase
MEEEAAVSQRARPPAAGPWDIRVASRDDVGALAQLFRQDAEWHQHLAGYYTLQPDFDWRAFVQTHLGRSARVILVADDGQHLLGCIAVRMLTVAGPRRNGVFWQRLWRRQGANAALPLQPCAWGVIDACVVVETHRRQGIGAALVTQALAWCNARGLHRVELGVLANNPAARAFWTHLGFATYRLFMHKTIPSA